MIAPCVDRVKRLPLALKTERNARVSWQSLYKFLRTDKIHPIIQRLLCTEQYYGDFGGSVFEVWSYDPAILARNACVDDISLLLSMDNDPNERIQMCLDKIREKHELPIKEEE